MFNPSSTTRGSLGRHSFKIGYEYQAINTEIEDFNPQYGARHLQRPVQPPAGAAADAATYNLADFLFGARTTYALTNPFIANLRQRMHFGYLQDDWKVDHEADPEPRLRYEFATPQWEKDNHLSNFDPATNTLIQAQGRHRSTIARWSIPTEQLRAARRPGLRDHGKTVIRSGYGISYIHFNRLGGENLLAYNGPHVVGLNINQQPHQAPCARQQRADDLLPADAAGLSRGLQHAGQLQHR